MSYLPVQSSGHYDVGFHQTPLMSSWMILANLTLLVGAVKCFGIADHWFNFSGTLHVLFEVGISYGLTKKYQILHNTLGLVVVVWLSVQLITGIISRVIQYSPIFSPTIIKWTKKIHQISSYLIIILAKFQYMIISYRRGKYGQIVGYLLFDLVFIMIYLWLKFKYLTLSEAITQNQLLTLKNSDLNQQISSGFFPQFWNQITQLKQNPKIKYLAVVYQSERQIPFENYCIFNDYVYDIEPLQQIHPGGQKVLELVKKREVDRFLYGIHPLQTISDTSIHKHTFNCLQICGDPVGRIQRSSPMKNIPDFLKVKLAFNKKIHPKSCIYLLNFSPAITLSQNWIQLKYEGFKNQKQIGQYFTLTVNDQHQKQKITKLYTVVWSLRPQNIEFIEKYFPGSTTKGIHHIKQKQLQNQQYIKFQKEQVIPLILKRYQYGEITSKFLDNQFQGEMILSKPMGGGLRYRQLPGSGKVIIICGGTGVFPFIDLIDLLFKRVKYLQKSNLSNILSANDPIVKQDIIENRQYKFYFGFQFFEDVHPMILYQINYLSHSKFINFKSFIRVKHLGSSPSSKHYPNISFQQNYFSKQLQEQFANHYGICKIYICGPHNMNQQILKILQNKKIPSDLYHYV